MKAEVDRILQSETLRHAEALRRLLAYLAEKSASGEADHLKEYTVGVDAFGKPAEYDPRHDSIVRLQAGRLRQKIAEYYRTEGKDDPIIIDLPKGHFRLQCETRSSPTSTGADTAASKLPVVAPRWRRVALALSIALVATLAWGTWSTLQLVRERRGAASLEASWSPDLDTLWAPFVTGDRPLIVAVGTPLFISLGGTNMLRDLSVNRWEDALQSPAIAAIRKALRNPDLQPRYHYAPIDELNAAFLLGRLLLVRQPHISLSTSTHLSLQELDANNMIFVGSPDSFDELERALPIRQELVQERWGIRNLHPHAGEPGFLADRNVFGPSEDGEVYVLISHLPGPLGIGDVETFTSGTSPGRLSAVQWLTDPALARTLAGKLRAANGKIPRYYQVVVRTKFKDIVPVETSYVLHRSLQRATRILGP